MARRYGGRFSPDGPTEDAPAARFRGRRAANVNIGARGMFIAPLPLLIAGLFEVMAGDAQGMIVELGAFGVLILGAVLLNEGLKAEDAYNARTIARPPAIPRKAFAAAATGVGVFVAAGLAAGSGAVTGALFAGAAVVAQLLAFGLDPMRAKGGAAASSPEADRVARAIDKAEATVAEILEIAKTFDDRPLQRRIEDLMVPVRDVFRAVEADPRDLSRARKFLGVYLTGARDATAKFAELYRRRRDPQARADYTALLDDLEGSFRKHREDLLLDDKSALDVEIEVLRERLNREGVTLADQQER